MFIHHPSTHHPFEALETLVMKSSSIHHTLIRDMKLNHISFANYTINKSKHTHTIHTNASNWFRVIISAMVSSSKLFSSQGCFTAFTDWLFLFQGCYDALTDWLKNNAGYIIGVGVGIIVLEVGLGAFIAIKTFWNFYVGVTRVLFEGYLGRAYPNGSQVTCPAYMNSR